MARIKKNVSGKLKSQSGETLMETLISIIIAVLCVALLSTSVVAASRINSKIKNSVTEGFNFEYSKASVSQKTFIFDEKDAAGNLIETGTNAATAQVDLYESNGYVYYTRTGGESNG